MKFPAHEPFADTDCDVRRGTLHRARPSATEQRPADAFKKAAHHVENAPSPTAVDKDRSQGASRISYKPIRLQRQDEVTEATVPDTCPRDVPSNMVDDGHEVQAGQNATSAC